jgi:branched-chain amino acid transport system ATP-binding protein
VARGDGKGAAPVLDLSGIDVSFGGIAALDDVSLAVAPGEVCGLIGANGAGKTTLFDVVSGIRLPDAGHVSLAGRDVTRWSPHRRARAGMRRTFQRVQLFGWLTVEENLLVATEWHGGGGGVLADLVGAPTRRAREAERRDRAREALARCGLEPLAQRRAAGLPIGTARLVELARALVDRPTLVLLDEPASGLDHAEAERFAGIVEGVGRDHGTSVLLVEHDVAFVLERCHRIVVLHLGRVLADGPPEAIRADPAVRDAYLGATAAA